MEVVATERPSLIGSVVAALCSPGPARPAGSDRGVAVALALLIAIGPIATIVGAMMLTQAARRDVQGLHARLAPRLAAAQGKMAARAILGAAAARPTLGATLEALAQALPQGATLTRATRDSAGRLELEVATTDPDSLRTALRRSGAFTPLRDMAERQGDGTMLVTLREERP